MKLLNKFVSLERITCFLLEHININSLDTPDRSVSDYRDLLISCGFNKPTRVHQLSVTVTDHTWVNKENIVSGAGIL